MDDDENEALHVLSKMLKAKNSQRRNIIENHAKRIQGLNFQNWLSKFKKDQKEKKKSIENVKKYTPPGNLTPETSVYTEHGSRNTLKNSGNYETSFEDKIYKNISLEAMSPPRFTSPKCPYPGCKIFCSNLIELKLHMKSHALVLPNRTYIPPKSLNLSMFENGQCVGMNAPEEAYYLCKFCNARFRIYKHYKYHIRNEHGNLFNYYYS